MHIEINEAIRSVLVVEDEMIVAMLMEDLLRSLGVEEVYIAADVKSALKVLGTRPVDCAVLDLWVRDGDTMAVADILVDKGIPFVFSSGSDAGAIAEVPYDELEHVRLTREFLNAPERFFARLGIA